MKEWKSYPKNRKISYEDGYVVIVPNSYNKNNDIMPLFCEVCQLRFNHKDDEKSYKKFKCCSPCADTWAYSNKEKWEKGWRPSEEVINTIVAKRSFVDPNIVIE